MDSFGKRIKKRVAQALVGIRHWRPVCVLRYHVYRYGLSFPRRVECNLCGWQGRRFLKPYEWGHLCPQCGSRVRHRLIGSALTRLPGAPYEGILRGKRILHFSPEYCLGLLLRRHAAQYVKADFFAKDCDLLADLTNMPQVNDGAYDVLVCCDVENMRYASWNRTE